MIAIALVTIFDIIIFLRIKKAISSKLVIMELSNSNIIPHFVTETTSVLYVVNINFENKVTLMR